MIAWFSLPACWRTSSTSSERSTRATRAPSRARRSATSWPIPCAAPVTRANLPAKRPGKVVIAASRRAPVVFADGGHGAGRRELLVIEVGGRHALCTEPTAHGIDHRRRAAEIDIHLAAVDMRGLDMRRHVALARVAAVGCCDAGGEGEAGDARGEGIELVDADEVGGVGHAVDHVDRMSARAGL